MDTNMDIERFEYIIARYLRGAATREEECELLSAIRSSEELHTAFRKQTATWRPNEPTDVEADRKWARIAAVIAPVAELAGRNMKRRMMKYSIAAAILLLCLSGATLLFLKQADSSSIPANGEWLTIVAQADDQTCVLPDGTSVFLRKGASLGYPAVFYSASRNVSICGEAFFDVTPDPEKPFVVDASELFVEVLGTSFSVSTSGAVGTIAVTLVEGSVCLSNVSQKELVRLEPNQKAEYSVGSGLCTVSEVDSERLTSWRKGIIAYDNASLHEIVRLIEQTYDVSLLYAKSSDDTQRFSGAFLKTQKLDIVLDQTSKLTGTKLKIMNEN